MGERMTYSLYKGVNKSRFIEGAELAAKDMGITISWDVIPPSPWRKLTTHHNDIVHSIWMPHWFSQQGDLQIDDTFRELIWNKLSVPMIELRIQEGDHWDYSISVQGTGCIDQFSTRPEYWGEENIENRGDPSILSKIWGIEKSKIDRYFIRWSDIKTDDNIKAYESDESCYGDIWQVLDFIRSLGGSDPNDLSNGSKQHWIEPPPGLIRSR